MFIKRNIFFASIAFLLGLLIILQMRVLKRERQRFLRLSRTIISYRTKQLLEKKSSQLLGSTLPAFQLTDLDGNIFRSKNIHSKLTMMVVFTPLDCVECLLEARVWQKIYKTYPSDKLTVIGVANSITEAHLRSFVRTKGLTFRILYDKEDEVKEKLGITETPVRLLIDSNHKILDVERPSGSQVIHSRVFSKLDRLLSAY